MADSTSTSSGCLPHFKGFSTAVIHDGQEPEKWNSHAVVPPISMATTFKQDAPGEHRGYDYSRSGNPTRNCFESTVASLEGAKHALTFASGLGASTILMMTLKAGDHVVVSDDVYGGSNRLFSKVMTKFGLEFDFIDCTNLELVEKTIRPGKTTMVWIETPTNPTMKCIDIKAIADIAHKQEGIVVVVDNTFMSPVFQRPLMWGADVAYASCTKYINGHSDAIMGSISTNNEEIYKQCKFLQNAMGVVPSPFDCFLANRGAKTLKVRMMQHQTNAMAVATFLESHPCIERVFYPGLKSHPAHELVKRQCTGFSGMVSAVLKGNLDSTTKFLQSLKIFSLAESLGGYESLIEHPALMTHASVAPEHRAVLGITDTFVRMSVGLEESEDLIEDIDQALKTSSGSDSTAPPEKRQKTQ